MGKLLGLQYPGGPVIDRLAKLGNPKAIRFAIPKITDRALDFSFSGVKTAVLQLVKAGNLVPKNEEETRQDPERLDLLASFQESIVEMLWSTTQKAARLLQPRSLMLSGGVAANSRLKEFLAEKAAAAGLQFYVPKLILTTDNAAMIAAAGTAKLMRGETAGFDFNVDPNMRLAVADNGTNHKPWRV